MSGLILPVVAVMLVVFGAVAFYVSRETRAETGRTGKHPEGHYRGLGMGAGIAIGAGIGIVVDAIPIGVPIGVAIGAGIGMALEKKHAHELRPKTEKEIQMKRLGLMLVFGLLTATMLIGLGLYFLRPE